MPCVLLKKTINFFKIKISSLKTKLKAGIHPSRILAMSGAYTPSVFLDSDTSRTSKTDTATGDASGGGGVTLLQVQEIITANSARFVSRPVVDGEEGLGTEGTLYAYKDGTGLRAKRSRITDVAGDGITLYAGESAKKIKFTDAALGNTGDALTLGEDRSIVFTPMLSSENISSAVSRIEELENTVPTLLGEADECRVGTTFEVKFNMGPKPTVEIPTPTPTWGTAVLRVSRSLPYLYQSAESVDNSYQNGGMVFLSWLSDNFTGKVFAEDMTEVRGLVNASPADPTTTASELHQMFFPHLQHRSGVSQVIVIGRQASGVTRPGIFNIEYKPATGVGLAVVPAHLEFVIKPVGGPSLAFIYNSGLIVADFTMAYRAQDPVRAAN